MTKLEKCKLCEKMFVPKNKRHLYCSPKHKKKCVVCGRDVIVYNKNLGFCGSSSCMRELSRNGVQAKYGVDNVSQLDWVQEKIKRNSLEKYGVSHFTQSKEYQEHYKKALLLKHGVDNVFKLDEVKEKIRKTDFDRYGVMFPSQNVEIRTKAQ